MLGLGLCSPRRGFLYAITGLLIFGCLVTFRPDRSLHLATLINPADCSKLTGLDSIFVIVKTGACEVHKKLPVHLDTTLQCIPPDSWAVLSDLSETVEGIPVYDSFAGDVKDEYLNGIDEFALYKKLNEVGSCEQLDPADLEAASTTPGNNGNFKSRGWNLDKWKYLPMVQRGWELKQNATWYLIIETDTVIVWPNLLRWIEMFDASKDHYLGSQMQIGDQLFSYGGGGTLVSNSAMQKVVGHFRADRSSLEQYTKAHWAGDCVFGKALQDVGVKLMWSWPHLLTESLGGVDYSQQNYGMRLWCSPVISYHHMTPDMTVDFWDFQVQWFIKNPFGLLRHRDVFTDYVLPRIRRPRSKWDNQSPDKLEGEGNPQPIDVAGCEKVCRDKHDCVQYSYGIDGCRTSKSVRLGVEAEAADPDIQSGWLMDRVEQFWKGVKRCSDHHEAWRQDFYGYAG